MDQETKQLLDEQNLIREVVYHAGWKHIEQRFFDKLLSLQNAFNIDTTKTPTTIAKEISINKKAHEILTEFWQDVKGTAVQAEENKVLLKDKSYIYKVPEQ